MRIHSNRRDFLKQSAALSAGFWIAGRKTWAEEIAATSPSEKINFASIGIGGKGDGDSDQVAKHGNLVAFCEVDEQRLGRKAERYPKARAFTDFRKMFDEMGKEIDAVTVSTPDHTHAIATMTAIKLGKHVYTQKPMTHDVWEARQLRLAAERYKVATQMGNQATAHNRLREGVELIRAGVIGPVREVHVWTNRPTGMWPQSPDIRERPPEAPVPPTLHWDDWLGTAPVRPFATKYYHPFNWRGWRDFGCGALGDMGCHTMNLPYMALRLGAPLSVEADSEEPNPETYPAWARVNYEFAERDGLPPVRLTWYEGHDNGKLVQPPESLVEKVLSEYTRLLDMRSDKRVADGKKVQLTPSGSIIVGTRGILYSTVDDGREWELLPAEAGEISGLTVQTLPRNPLGDDIKTMDEGHKLDWIAAIKGGPKAMSNFDYAGPLTETVLLGNVAILARGTKLDWDPVNLKFPNHPAAEKWLKREYRSPWVL